MKTEMFILTEQEDCTSVKTIRTKHYDLIEEINTSLKQQSFSTSELYQIMIFKGLLKPTYFREFEKIVRLGVRQARMRSPEIIEGKANPLRIAEFKWYASDLSRALGRISQKDIDDFYSENAKLAGSL